VSQEFNSTLSGIFDRVVASCWTPTQVADISRYLNITVKQKLGYPPSGTKKKLIYKFGKIAIILKSGQIYRFSVERLLFRSPLDRGALLFSFLSHSHALLRSRGPSAVLHLALQPTHFHTHTHTHSHSHTHIHSLTLPLLSKIDACCGMDRG